MSSNRFEHEFTAHVISSDSMNIFQENTLANFRSFFNDEINLTGDWRVPLSEIIFPTKVEHKVKGDLVAFSLRGFGESQNRATGSNVISRPYNEEKLAFMAGTYDTVAQLLATIKRTFRLLNFFANRLMKNDDTKTYYGDFPADLCAGKQLIFIYKNIIEYQYVGDAKALLLRVIDLEQRLKNGSVCELEPTRRIVFTNLDYVKLLSNTIQSISIELRTETGQLVPFSGTGNFILTLQFKKFVD